MKSTRHAQIGAAIAVTAALALGAPATAETVSAPPGGNVEGRLAGADRFGTAVAASQHAHPGTVPVVYLASGVDFPDALSAGPIVAKEGGSLLLTGRNELPAEVGAEIQRLQPGRVVLVGGTAAIGDRVENAARALVADVVRVAGANRYETSRALAEAAFPETAPAVFIATGRGYADALSAGAAAAKAGAPVLLVEGNTAGLDAASTALVERLAPSSITVVGGTAVVSDRVLRGAEKLAGTVTRIAGDDRFATSAAIASTWGTAPRAYVASGENFPDALVGSALAGAEGVPLFVIRKWCQYDSTFDSQGSLGTASVTLLGGPESIKDGSTTLNCANIHS
ncbi:cell wall-binding repeat-containing protein [Leifsonia sp. NPDC056665]|uniref:cell wall-binding repeat-containing protein n=1 Tax=Leifsonia sp. NPDC056665 TaxID=3345901 RepID=UPI0036B36BCD